MKKKEIKIHKKHKRKTSTNVHLQNDCCFGGRSKQWRKDLKVAEDGGNGGGSSLCAHHPRRVVGP